MRRIFLFVVLAMAAVGVGGCSNKNSDDPTPPAATTPAASASPASSATTPASPATSPPSTATAGQPAPSGVKSGKLGVPSGLLYTSAAPAFDALAGAKESTGQLGNAVYRIEMPDSWNGELVMYAHGYRGESLQLTVSSPPRVLRELFIKQGYAWAASSYEENGYAPGTAADNTLALKKLFETQFGKAKRTYIYGESMGGNVVALSLEHFPAEYDGALAVCGALGGQTEIDYLAGWSLLAEYITGVKVPIGESIATVNATTLLQLSSALGSTEAPTEKGKQFISAIRLLTGGARPFFFEGFQAQYVANFAYLLVDPMRKLPVTRAATNSDLVYAIGPGLGLTSAQLNAGVRRLAADPAYRNATTYPDRVPTTAKITKPLLTLHDTGDLFVPITHEVEYLAKAMAAGTSNLLVQRAIREAGHCRFSEAEQTAAWNDLVAWVRDAKKPAGDDFSGDLSDIGKQFTNPLRAGDPGGR